MGIQLLATSADSSALFFDQEKKQYILEFDTDEGRQETVYGCRETAIAAFFHELP